MALSASPSDPVAGSRRWVLLSNALTPYMRSKWRLSTDALEVRTYRSILGVIPIAAVDLTWRLSHVRGLQLTKRFFPWRLFVAVALGALAGFGSLPPAGAVLVGVIAVVFLILSYVAVLEVVTIDTPLVRIPVCLIQRRFCLDLVDNVNRAIDEYARRGGPGRTGGERESDGNS